jgi:hypothetical protein
VEKARKIAEERGWTWCEPVELTPSAEQGEPVWVLKTNVMMRSPSVRIVFRESDHAVIQTGYLPR